MSSQTLYIEHDGQTHEVETLGDGTESVSSFYSWDDPNKTSANTGLEIEDTSQMFFYHGSNGISLVFIHDIANDDDGGAASISFGSPPADLSWVVRDDPGIDGPGGERGAYSQSGASWQWGYTRTDGGAVRGGFDEDFHMTVSAAFQNIESWVFRDGKGGTVTLNTGNPVTLASRQPTQNLDETANINFDVTKALEQCGFQGKNEGHFGRKDCQSRSSGKTPPLLYYDVTIACGEILSFDIAGLDIDIGDRTVVDMWIGFNPVTLCWWVGTSQPETCTRLDETCAIMQTARAIGITESIRMAALAVEALEESTELNYPEAIIVVLAIPILLLIYIADLGTPTVEAIVLQRLLQGG